MDEFKPYNLGSKMQQIVQSEGIARLMRQQAALADFGTYALQETSLLNILKEAARVCANALDVPFSKVCRYRIAENDLLIEAGHGWKESVIGQVSAVNESSPQGRAYISGQPVIIPNVRDAQNLSLQGLETAHGIVSTANVVIKRRDGIPYGVLEMDSPVQHTCSKNDIAFLTSFADLLSEILVIFERKQILQTNTNHTQRLVTERDTLVAKNATLVAEKRALVAENYRLFNEHSALSSEFNYRTRNNLQVVYSMLARHLDIETTEKQKSSIRRIIRRVMTQADGYVRLFSVGTGRTINLGAYLTSLCDSLPSLQANSNPDIKLICSAEILMVNIDTVTAVGMVVAELVSNSYEHAFGEGAGTINVKLHQTGSDTAVLTVSDDGSGFIEQVGSKRHGVGLVRRLMEQVRGSVELCSEGGTIWTFRFPAVPASHGKSTLH